VLTRCTVVPHDITTVIVVSLRGNHTFTIITLRALRPLHRPSHRSPSLLHVSLNTTSYLMTHCILTLQYNPQFKQVYSQYSQSPMYTVCLVTRWLLQREHCIASPRLASTPSIDTHNPGSYTLSRNTDIPSPSSFPWIRCDSCTLDNTLHSLLVIILTLQYNQQS
jgi:hypothetical protein